MTDSNHFVYYLETDNDGFEYACYLDLINSSDSVIDEDIIECIELDLNDDLVELDVDD